ncbi:MAG: alpha/beta hydrolase [Candidatus Eremiobacteraeota bacterium]|nr:alpha/beta hydrolase [Candidatus Eremiobacteraeota bacterium]
MFERPISRPAMTYDDALVRARAFEALDDGSILPEAHTRLLTHGSKVPVCAVLFHGFTNCPNQFVEFAPLVHALGYNVFIPRLPEHGDRNRMTTRLARLTATQLLAAASEAVDIAQGLGERVMLMGISSSGVLCAYFAQYRADIARAVPVNPFFSMLSIPYWADRAMERILSTIPNAFLWWDPRAKENELPQTGYPRFSTRALAQVLQIGDDVYARAKNRAPQSTDIRIVTNKCDPAVNNSVTARVVAAWRSHGAESVRSFEFTDLPRNHDIIDPQNAVPRTDIVYPKLLELLS